MKIGVIFIFGVSICHPFIFTASARTNDLSQLRRGGPGSRRIDPVWLQKICEEETPLEPLRKKFFKRESSMMDSDGGGDSGDSSTSSGSDTKSMMTTLKSVLKRIPQINFYSSIPNSIGVIGQGFSVLEKLSTALGTPLPYYIGSLPVTLFGIALIFIPDLTTLSLFGFYPNGAGDNDPLSAFPPSPNLDGIPDVDLSLSPDNIPPRIIPPSTKPADDIGNQLPPLPPSDSSQEVEDEDSPTNPESFQAPRRKIGGREDPPAPYFKPSHYPLPPPLPQQLPLSPSFNGPQTVVSDGYSFP